MWSTNIPLHSFSHWAQLCLVTVFSSLPFERPRWIRRRSGILEVKETQMFTIRSQGQKNRLIIRWTERTKVGLALFSLVCFAYQRLFPPCASSFFTWSYSLVPSFVFVYFMSIFFSREFFFWATVRASLFQILCSRSRTQRTPQDYYAKPKKNDSSVLYTPAIFFAFIFTSFFWIGREWEVRGSFRECKVNKDTRLPTDQRPQFDKGKQSVDSLVRVHERRGMEREEGRG